VAYTAHRTPVAELKKKMRESLGQRIRRKRKEKDFGLREAATKLDISPTYLSEVERDVEPRPPAERVIRAIAELFDDDFDQLMTMAGRVSEDVEAFITKDPKMPQFLRQAQAKKLTDVLEYIAGDPTMPKFLRAARDRNISGDELLKMLEKGGKR
jgi:transcriptional regulator with XRE-family HTH domain